MSTNKKAIVLTQAIIEIYVNPIIEACITDQSCDCWRCTLGFESKLIGIKQEIGCEK
jgi:hypothetical protein